MELPDLSVLDHAANAAVCDRRAILPGLKAEVSLATG